MAYFNGRDILLAGLKGEKGEKGEKGDPGDLGDHIVQTTGESETAVMSQKAATEQVCRVFPNLMKGIGISGDYINLSEIETRDSFVDFNGNIGVSDGYAHTTPIELKRGHTVALWGSGYQQRVAMISVYDSDNEVYMVKAVSKDSSGQLYAYTATEDSKVVFSYDYRKNHNVLLTSKNIQALTEYVYSDISFDGEVWGKHVNANGVISGGANDFRHTPPITIKAGQTVVLVGSGYNQAVSMISKYNGEDENLTPLVISTNSNVNEYKYHCTEDTQIILSYDKTKEHYAYHHIEFVKEKIDVIDYSVMFPKVAVIGDSLSSGCLYIDGSGNDYYGDSWLTFLSRKCGLKRNHYSRGGLTAKTWLDEFSEKLTSDEVSNAYFIALGTNDGWFNPYEMGTSSDVVGSNTFAGYYKSIIELVRSKAPNSAIFCLSLYKENQTFNPLIKTITELYDKVYYIDIPTNSEINPDTGGVWSAGSHFTTVGYKYIANVIYEQMNEIVKNNLADFKFFGQYNYVDGQYDY